MSTLLKYRIYYIPFCVAIWLFLLMPHQSYAAQTVVSEPAGFVLVIGSFHQGQKWSDDIGKGIMEVFTPFSSGVELAFEHLDAKHFTDTEHINNFYRLLKHKYRSRRPAVVITSDDNAFNFVLKYKNELFPDIPIVFCGLKYFDQDYLYGYSNITGVVESIGLGKNIELALSLFPKTKRINFIVDNGATSTSFIRSSLPVLKRYQEQVAFHFLPFLCLSEMQKALSQMQPGDLVFLINFSNDLCGKSLNNEQSAALLTNDSSIPFFSLWDSFLGHGILGGWMVSGQYHGHEAGIMALKIMQGQPVKTLKVAHKSRNYYMFDYNVLKNYSIADSKLPDVSLIVNRPFSLYREYRKEILLLFLGGTILSLLVFALSINILRRRKIEKSLKTYSSRLSFLHETDQAVLEMVSLPETINKVLCHVRVALDCERATVVLFDYDSQKAKIFAISSRGETLVVPGDEVELCEYNSSELSNHHYYEIKDMKNLTHPNKVESNLIQEGVETVLRLPLVSRGVVLGLLSLGGKKDRFSQPEVRERGREVAGSMAIAIQTNNIMGQLLKHEQELESVNRYSLQTLEEERRYISLELHDQLGQTLTAISLDMAMVLKKLSKSKPQETEVIKRLNKTYELVDMLSEQVHDLSLDLRPPMLDDLGLIPALRWYVSEYSQRINAQVHFHAIPYSNQLTPLISITIYRIAQEALNNVAKYAEAQKVLVSVICQGNQLVLTVKDDGKGFNPSQEIERKPKCVKGLGLVSMKERMKILGGKLQVVSSEGQGTEIRAYVPLGDNL